MTTNTKIHTGEVPATWPRTKSGDLKHNHPVIFGRKEDGCYRCDELKAGAAPRDLGYTPRNRKAEDEQWYAEVRAHLASEKHLSGGCGICCTFGDW